MTEKNENGQMKLEMITHNANIELNNGILTENSSKIQSNEESSDNYLDIKDEDPMKRKLNWFGRFILYPRNIIAELNKKPYINKVKLIVVCLLFIAYFVASMIIKNPFDYPKNENSTVILQNYVFSNNTNLALFVLTVIGVILIIWDNLIIKLINRVESKFTLFEPIIDRIGKYRTYVPWIITILVTIGSIIYLIIDLENYYNLVPISGIFLLVFISCLISVYPSDINWRCLIVGLLLQFIVGVLILRVEFGYRLFKFLGDQMTIFLEYTDYGTELLFGTEASHHFLAMRGLPIGIFFAGVVNMLYYLGAVQYVILKCSWVVNKLMDTSPTESINAVASIFLGQAESPLLIKPFLPEMTVSELFSVMLAGLATVAGSTMGAYIGLGVKANHLLTTSIMSAPAALAISKVIYPEIQVSKADWERVRNLPRGTENNIFEAFSIGACNMVKPFSWILANLLAFRSLFQFIDAIFAWFFNNIGLKEFGLVSMLQYPFSVLALSMGVDKEDSFTVARLLAKKVFINELVSYQELGRSISFREGILKNGTFELYRNGTYEIPFDGPMIWNEKSTVILTYALCGFSSFCSLGICIGAMTALAPTRKNVFARLAVKAQIGGNITCFLTACFAGLLYKQHDI